MGIGGNGNGNEQEKFPHTSNRYQNVHSFIRNRLSIIQVNIVNISFVTDSIIMKAHLLDSAAPPPIDNYI